MSKKDNRLKIFSALEVANICGVVNQTSINWIKNRHLKAFTTPGGQYRVYAEDLADFLDRRGMKIPESLVHLRTGNEKGKRKGNRILVIDNDKAFTDLLAEKFSNTETDCEVKTSISSFDAGAVFSNYNPEIIILSDTMPDLTPVKIREFCLNNNITRKIKIIFLRLPDRPEDKNEGADLVLVKPPDMEKIIKFSVRKYGEQ